MAANDGQIADAYNGSSRGSWTSFREGNGLVHFRDAGLFLFTGRKKLANVVRVR
jgi:hypothetical protein